MRLRAPQEVSVGSAAPQRWLADRCGRRKCRGAGRVARRLRIWLQQSWSIIVVDRRSRLAHGSCRATSADGTERRGRNWAKRGSDDRHHEYWRTSVARIRRRRRQSVWTSGFNKLCRRDVGSRNSPASRRHRHRTVVTGSGGQHSVLDAGREAIFGCVEPSQNRLAALISTRSNRFSVERAMPAALSFGMVAWLACLPNAFASYPPHASFRCPPKLGHILRSDTQASVYRTREYFIERQETVDGPEHYRVPYASIHGCVRRTGRSYRLGEPAWQIGSSSGSQGGGISNLALAGTVVALEESSESTGPLEGEGHSTWRVVVRDLRNGRTLHRVPTGSLA